MTQETKNIVTVALLAFAALAWFWPVLMAIHIEEEDRKKRNEPPPYDERQHLARMRAGNHALYALLGFLLAWAAADQFGWFWWTGSVLDMTLCGMLLAYSVWSADCILHDAIAGWNDRRPDFEFLPLAYCGSIFIWLVPTPGKLCDSWMPFIFGCAGVVFLLSVAIYKMRKRKKAEAEDTP